MTGEFKFEDDAHDERFFDFLNDLLKKNISRYEKQTEDILKTGSIKVDFSGAVIEFKITPTGCSFVTTDNSCPQTTDAWIRMGWGKSAKRRALPNYFAQAEASVLINRQEG